MGRMRWGGVSEGGSDEGLDDEGVDCVIVSDGSITVSVVGCSKCGDADAVGGNTVASRPRERTGVVGEDWSSWSVDISDMDDAFDEECQR